MQKRILLVEDERAWIDIFLRILRDYEVDVATSIEEAMTALNAGRYNLILAYVSLEHPWFAQTFLQDVHSRYPEIPIIGFTGSSKRYSEVFALGKMGLYDFIHKGEFTTQSFLQRVEAALSSSSGTSFQTASATPLPIIRILFLAADPADATRLRLGQELREIQEKLQLAKLRDQFKLDQRMSVRPADVSQAMLDMEPQIVHFSGHGTTTSELCFENQIGETHPIQPEALAALFEQFADQVSCVVLNACYSEAQANAIAQHIDYVIGMNQEIGDEAAIAFAIGFYQALGAGRTVEEAYKLGCVQIRLQDIPEHLTPVMVKKGQVQP